MTTNPWLLLPLAIPILLLGEFIVRRVALFNRFCIPVPVVGGMIIALIVLAINLIWPGQLSIGQRVSAAWYTWLTTAEPDWLAKPSQVVYQPLIGAFFTCIGLNASWQVAKKGSWQILLFLGLASLLAVSQNIVGVSLAKAMDVSPYLGLICGSVAMTGGHGTALGLADTFVKAGFTNANVVGAAAATFGLVCGSMIGGPIGTRLITYARRRAKITKPADHTVQEERELIAVERSLEVDSPDGKPLKISLEPHHHGGAVPPPEENFPGPDDANADGGFIAQCRELANTGVGRLLLHLAILLVCIKLGAWVSFGLKSAGLNFPVYIGAMVLGIILRNVLDAVGKPVIKTPLVDLIGTIVLSLFLVMAMMSLNLIQLRDTAGPMLILLGAQVVMMALFAALITFPLMGRDYDAAVMAGGHCGFGLGATPNAVANMEALTQRHGPSPRAFLIVSIVGGFLIDFTNSLNITYFLNYIK